MKPIFETAIGSDAKGGLYVEGEDLALVVKMPYRKVLQPVEEAVNKGIDKLEALIPGDQKALAEKLKKELAESIANLIIEQLTKPQAAAEVQSEAPVAHV